MAIEIRKDSKIVDVMVAQAKHENVDSNVAAEASNLIKDLASNPTPNNRYQIAQLVGFAVNEIVRPATNFLDMIADVKRVGFNEKAAFKVKQEGIRAYIQAKGATTARSKVANKQVTLDTVAVSARPVINIVELKTGQTQMADLINDAAYQMELKELGYIKSVLNAAATNWTSPFYASGSGVVKATIDNQIRYWNRVSAGGGATIIGDIDIVSKLAEQTGFAANTTTKQFADSLIEEANRMGYIGIYNGAKVINMINPIVEGTNNTFALDTDKLYILPSGADAAMRPLKVVFEGDIFSQEATNIDDSTYEVRLDQYLGAGIVYGDRPYLSVYEDTTL